MKKSRIILITILITIIIIINALPIFILGILKGYKDVDYHMPEDYGLTAKEVNLRTDDNLNLKAWQVDAKNPKGMIIFLSGLGNPSVTAYYPHAKMMKEKGYSSLLLEMRAHGKSEGRTITLGFNEVLDVKSASQYIKSSDKYKNLPLLIFGRSMGGATAINSLGKIDDIDGIISLSSYSAIEDAFEDLLVNMKLPNFFVSLEKNIFEFYLKINFGADKIKSSPIYNITNLNNKPILLMHSEKDSKIPFNSLKRLVHEADKHSDKVNTYIVDGDKHFIIDNDTFKKPENNIEYSEAIFNFLDEYFK